MSDLKSEFSIIYDEHIERIYRFVFMKVSSKETAEDLSSEVFVRVWKNYGKTDVQNMQAFLYQVARHVIADYYRKAEKTKIVLIEQELDVEDISASPEEKAIVSMDMDQVRKALIKLNDDYQNYIIWRYIEELTLPEIAQILDKKEDNVRVGVHRALRALNEAIEGENKAEV